MRSDHPYNPDDFCPCTCDCRNACLGCECDCDCDAGQRYYRRITIREAGELLDVSPSAVRRWVRAGYLTEWRVGPIDPDANVDRRRILVQLGEIEEMLHYRGIGNAKYRPESVAATQARRAKGDMY